MSHQQHDTVEENDDTDLPARIGTQSSADKEKEGSTQKRTNHDSDEDNSPAPHPKKSKGRKRSKKKATVIDSDHSLSEDQVITKKKPTKTTKNLAASIIDTDVEEIPNPKESPDEELGQF